MKNNPVSQANPRRIVIIDPSQIVQTGLRTLIDKQSDFKVVGSLYSMNRFEEQLATMRPEIILLNPILVEFHRREEIQNLFGQLPLVAIAYSYLSPEVLKNFNSVIGIYSENNQLIDKIKEAIQTHQPPSTNTTNSDLSEREKEILIAVAKGMMNKNIAALHQISIHTVISHRKNISRKTGIKSISGLTVYALLNNLIDGADKFTTD